MTADQPAGLASALSALRVEGEWQPLSVEVEATSEGCAAVALSIWNRRPDAPLDYVVQSLTIGPGECELTPRQQTLPAALLAVLGGKSKADSELADAALHVYEMVLESERHNAAVLVIREPEPGEKQFYSWVLGAPPPAVPGRSARARRAVPAARRPRARCSPWPRSPPG